MAHRVYQATADLILETRGQPPSLPAEPANCERCGEPATCELRFPAVSDRWATYCGGCHQQIAEDCAEVAEHEIDHFGGAYGVPSFEARPIGREPESMVDPCKRARELGDGCSCEECMGPGLYCNVTGQLNCDCPFCEPEKGESDAY